MEISGDDVTRREELAALGPYVAPSTPEEKMIAAIWSRVLRVDRVGAQDGYFDFDRDSLSAANLVIEVEERFSIQLNLAAILGEASTVAGMARLVVAERGKQGADAFGQTTSAAGLSHRVEVAPTDFREPGRRERRLIGWRDVSNTIAFSVLATAGLGPGSGRSISRFVSRLHLMLRGYRPERFRVAAPAVNSVATPFELERGKLADVYLEIFHTLRAYFFDKRPPPGMLIGKEHLDGALEKGRGAVVWIGTSDCGGLTMLEALSDAGHAPVLLSSDVHPYSGTTYGRRVLNPLRTKVENRCLAKRVVLSDGEEAGMIERLASHLQANRVVAIAAIASSARPAEIPFLDGTLRLALGAPALATLGGAPLLPVFVAPMSDGGFEVSIEPPLQNDLDGPASSPERLAAAYARRLAAFVERHPTVWGGWSDESQWRPR